MLSCALVRHQFTVNVAVQQINERHVHFADMRNLQRCPLSMIERETHTNRLHD